MGHVHGCRIHLEDINTSQLPNYPPGLYKLSTRLEGNCFGFRAPCNTMELTKETIRAQLLEFATMSAEEQEAALQDWALGKARGGMSHFNN